MNQLLTTKQLSNITGFNERTIRTWCDRGDVFPTARKIPNISTGQWRVLSDDVALVAMMDGQDANAQHLADTNGQITALQTDIDKLQNRIESLQAQLVKEREANKANQNALWDRIEALEPYKKHYEQRHAA